MLSKAKSNSVITHHLNAERNALVFRVLGAGECTLNLHDVHEKVAERAFLHGMIQRCSDGGAIGKDPETGKSATPQDKLERIKRIVDHYNSGAHEWSLNRTSDGTSNAGYLFMALCALNPKTDAEKIREWLKGKTRAEQNALRKQPDVMAKIDEIKASEPVDEDAVEVANEMLDELKDLA